MRPKGFLLLAVALAPVHAETDPGIRAAVTRSLPLVERSAAAFVAKRACVSCHHNILPIFLLHMARGRGFTVDASVLDAVEQKTFRQLHGPAALETAVEAATLNDPTPDDSFLLMAAHAAGIPADAATGTYAHRLVHWQRDGHWVTSDFRPPHSSSVFTASATAVRAIHLYLPPELKAEGEQAMAQARLWFSRTPPTSTEDAAFRLLGLVWAGAGPRLIESARRDLLHLERPGGGWGELPGYPEDAYSTGESLFALHEAGMPANASEWQRGTQYLLHTQAADGSWRVHTRMVSPANVSPEYFTTGFPYEKDEYLSYAATCWAVMALLSALPETAPPEALPSSADPTPPWIHTALFGSASELRRLLDAGLDPNAKTAGGAALLMLAAPDAEKVRILIARGADVKARTSTGTDALTIAAAYRGTADSIRALLAAGAEAQRPAGIKVRSSPLVFASMTGDLENVRLLLAAGADPARAAGGNTPLTAALTFGYADVSEALVAAGASAHITETSGINLLHWAAITNRPQVIPLLVKAGVPLNATDENGFTPLMYAATLDFGDTAVLEGLLRAGADKSIRNAEGRTAREQARYYGHARIAAALR
ncbi:MAG TPA: ankyrin repeat domain-containing protein [Bryobacteraceae bacterium]|nr:ankyrin repeat domain-containing protein [Bryobacteraceae bacterium]